VRGLAVLCFLSVPGLLLSGNACRAQVVTIDLRTHSEVDQYYVVFTAREGVLGHAFVAWGHESERVRMSAETAFGMYPSSAWKTLFGPVPGGVVEERLRGESGLRLIARVNEHAYLRTREIVDAWRQTTYTLTARDCVTFTAEVARALGLQVPRRRGLSQLAGAVRSAIGAGKPGEPFNIEVQLQVDLSSCVFGV